jgi:hypothetical protein
LHSLEGPALPSAEALGHEFARDRSKRQALPAQMPGPGEEDLLGRLGLQTLAIGR